MKSLFYSMVAAILLVYIGACASASQSAPAPVTKPNEAPAKVATADWEDKWQTTLAAAKKERSVMVYSMWNSDVRTGVSQAFLKKYGIGMEFVPFGRGAEMVSKIQAEQRAGLHLVDAIGAGGPTLLTIMKPAGIIGRLEPLLVLPEVLDAKVWPNGRVPFSDQEHHSIPMTATAQRFITYNQTMVKAGEITSYKDLLNPRYKGKINLGDPTVTGSGNAFFAHIARNIWNLDEARQYLERLITEQNVEIVRDYRVQVEGVARGKYSIGLATRGFTVADFIAVGAPIAQVPLKEVYVSHADGVLAVPKELAHPAAATIFVNWLLSKEGQTVFSKSSGNPVMRTDVLQEGIDPIFVTKPEEKLFFDTEEYIIFMGDMVQVAKDIVDAHSK